MSTAPAGRPGPLGATERLQVRTVEVDDPGTLVDLLPAGPVVAWLRRGEGLIGFGETLRVDVHGGDRFTELAAAWGGLTERAVVRDEVDLPGTGPVAFVSMSFSPTSPAGSVLVVPRTVVGHRDGRWWVTTTDLTTPQAGVTRLPHRPELPEPEPVQPPGQVSYADGAMPGPRWMRRVADAVGRIVAGDLDKVVLARDLEVRTSEPVDLRWVLSRLAASYPTCWTFAVDGLVGATPEMLVRSERGLVTSRVLAGTIRRTGDDAHDLALAASLARSSKDLEEHEYAVRSVADALTPHCASTNVPEAPFVLHLPNVMHLATDVTGVLPHDGSAATVLDLAASLHPSAAVCGTPTDVAAALIGSLEGMDRDRYAGPVGWVDARGDGELGIALRSARLDPRDPRSLRLFAGCGIVAGSDPAAELAESDAKLVPMRDALG